MDGPVGEMVRQQNRHGFRPSHIHFLIGGDGYRELVTALYFGDDEHIDSDTVFGVSGSLVVSARRKIRHCLDPLRAERSCATTSDLRTRRSRVIAGHAHGRPPIRRSPR